MTRALESFDLATGYGRYRARKAGHDVPLRPCGRRPRQFWDGVEIGASSDCWLWRKRLDRDGYGVMWSAGRARHAHTVAFEMSSSSTVPSGFVVRHTCDVRACVNPAHLLVGTQADNIADKMARGRQAIGSRVGSALLTEDQVREIKCRYVKGNGGVLGREFGVTHGCIYRIVRGYSWTHVHA